MGPSGWWSAGPKPVVPRRRSDGRMWFEARLPVDLAILLQNVADVHASLGPDAQYRLRQAVRELLNDDFREGT